MSAQSNSSASLVNSLRSIATSILSDPKDKMLSSLDELSAGTSEEQLDKVSTFAEYLAAQLEVQKTARSSLRKEQEGTVQSLSSAMFWPLAAYGTYHLGSALWSLRSGIARSCEGEKSEAA